MEKGVEEEFVFYRFATDDLSEAYCLLNLVNCYKRELIRSTLLKMAIISYSRPFKPCHGKYRLYKIEDNIIPKQYRNLHQKIITYRDQIFAHSDIFIKKPSVNKFRTGNKIRFDITYKGFTPKDFHHEIEKMKELIKEVLSLLNLHIEGIEQTIS